MISICNQFLDKETGQDKQKSNDLFFTENGAG